MDVSSTVVRFRISGTSAPDAKSLIPSGLLQDAEQVEMYEVQSHRSGEQAIATDARPGTDVVVIKLAGGPALVLHPDTARTLLTSGMASHRDAAGDDVPVTATLPWTSDQSILRGSTPLGTVLKWFGIIRGDTLKAAAQNAAVELAKQIDARVQEGLYQLNTDIPPEGFGDAERVTEQSFQAGDHAPFLILVHGTFVNTASTFGKLWATHPAVVDALFRQYGNRVLAFDHPTVLASPVANALALAAALPGGVVVDLVTHSRGGIIAEILVRAGAGQFSADDLAGHFSSFGAHQDHAQLLALHDLLQAKKIVVRRVVRVACPARGTLLASGRLDAYLSVFHWLLEQANLHVSALLLGFLRVIARQGTRPEVLPGIAAMEPASAIVKWLNAPMERVDNSLYVLAGDSSGESVLGWLKTLVADAFYWTDNDLVVQTRSMYGGVPRAAAAAAKFMRFEGEQVSHFSYFAFDKSAQALADALTPSPVGPWQLIGPMSWAGHDTGGLRAPRQASRTAPFVIVVPDVFGSHLALASNGRRIWLTGTSPAEFALLDPASNVALRPDGLVSECYGKLCERLAETHDVVEFPYDWRLPLEAEAARLARAIAQRMDDPAKPGRPIRVVAHGMGGLLLRVMHLTERAVWDRMMALDGSRILMLGVPQHGTWTPLQVLSGDDTFGNILGATGPLFGETTARDILARMPGFIQLQAGLADTAYNLDAESSWTALQQVQLDMLAAHTRWHAHTDTWAIPPQHLLTGAATLWRKLNQESAAFSASVEKIVLIAGSAPTTPAGVTRAGDEMLLDCADDGDGRVTFDSSRLPGHKVWRIQAEHGQMPRSLQNFGALVDLLVDGNTGQLEENAITGPDGTARHGAMGAVACKPRRFRHAQSSNPPKELLALFDVHADDVEELPRGDRLAVRINHSDLRFVRLPLIVGHYQSLSLSGSEAVVDSLVNGRMSKAVRAGIYPEHIGSAQIFENGRHIAFGRRKQRYIPRPKAAIVVGLGEEGKLNAQHLSFTIRNGIIAFAERLAEGHDPQPTFQVASTLVGSGGTGITISNAALALVQAITDANQKLKEAGWPQVTELEIVEMYLDRATDAWRVLSLHAQANPERLSVEKLLREGDGRMRRPLDSSYRGATYDFITALRAEASQPGAPVIAYSLDTKRARTEVRAQRAQGPLLRDLVAQASNSCTADPLIRRTLFNLLVPVEIEPYLAGSTDIVMELDEDTSALPWELLETDTDVRPAKPQGLQVPWAIRSKVIRKLRTGYYRAQVVDASIEDNILIIGEPKVDAQYGRLPGAQREAESVAKAARSALGAANDRVTILAASNDANEIINQLFARSYRMIHIAGHGTGGPNGGVILSGTNTYLGRNEVESMRITPELVFINCCYVAQRSAEQVYDRVTFAANIAESLIKIGVRCVVAAGWAVEDMPAERFANGFYTALFDGARFIEAVGEGRKAAWLANPAGNTWAAYQCYGDPDWSFRTARTALPPAPKDEYAAVASSTTLVLVLQSIAIDALYTAPGATAWHRTRLEYLEEKFAGWAAKGEVAEEFGNAYAALPDRHKAQSWCRQAMRAPDGTASMNALVVLAEQGCLPGASMAELKESIGMLKSMLQTFEPTLRRHALLGIALKRMSVALTGAQPDEGLTAADYLAMAIDAFAATTQLPKGDRYDSYPLRALLECRLRQRLLATSDALPPNWFEKELTIVETLIDRAAQENPDFWTVVAQSQLDIMKAVMARNLRLVTPQISRSLIDLQRRIANQRFWIYIYDDTRFLLDPYLALDSQMDSAERQAAAKLVEQLRDYCKELTV